MSSGVNAVKGNEGGQEGKSVLLSYEWLAYE